MSGITDALYAYRAHQREDDASRVIILAITAALFPFKATEVCLYLDRDMYLESLFIEIKNLPGVKLKLDVNRDLAIQDPYGLYLDMAKQAYDALTSIPRIEPPGNCHLGEN